jgi:hypothetical protein
VRDGRNSIGTVARTAVAGAGRGGTVSRERSRERQLSAGGTDVDGLGVLADIPVVECGAPVADVSAGDLGSEGLGGTRCNREFVELTQDDSRVIGTTERDVELRNFLALDRASVSYSGSDGVEDVVKTGVASRGTRGGKKRLRGAWRRTSREAVVATVVRVFRRSAKVGRVEVRVDVVLDGSDISGEDIVGRVVRDSAVDGCSFGEAGGRNVSRSRSVDRDRDVRVAEVGVWKTITKLVDGGLTASVKGSVIDENTLLELSLRRCTTIVVLVEKIGTVRLTGLTQGEGKLAWGVDLAVENIDNGVAWFLSRNTSPQNGSDILVVVPVVDQDGTNGVKHNNSVLAETCNVADDSLASLPESEVVAITLITIDDDVTLSSVGIGEDWVIMLVGTRGCLSNASLTDTSTIDFVGTLSKNIDLAEGSTIKDTFNRLAVRAYFGLDGRVRCNQVREVSGSAAPAPIPKVSKNFLSQISTTRR